MEDKNLYASPDAEVEVETAAGEQELATRGSRLLAIIIDTIVMFIAIFAVMFVVFAAFFSTSGPDSPLSLFGLPEDVVGGLAGVISFVVINGYLLATTGQTVGKRALGIRIVSYTDGELLPIGKLLALRYGPLWVLNMLPFLGGVLGPLFGLVDSLFIFNSERRCIHDYIAGTKVVKVN